MGWGELQLEMTHHPPQGHPDSPRGMSPAGLSSDSAIPVWWVSCSHPDPRNSKRGTQAGLRRVHSWTRHVRPPPPWRGKPGENVCCACAYVSIPVSRLRIDGYAQADAIQLCCREGLSMCGGQTTHSDSSSLRNPPPPSSNPTGGPDLLQPGPLPHILRLPSTHHLHQAQRSSWAPLPFLLHL